MESKLMFPYLSPSDTIENAIKKNTHLDKITRTQKLNKKNETLKDLLKFKHFVNEKCERREVSRSSTILQKILTIQIKKKIQDIKENENMEKKKNSKSTRELFHLKVNPLKSGTYIIMIIDYIDSNNQTLYDRKRSLRLTNEFSKNNDFNSTPSKIQGGESKNLIINNKKTKRNFAYTSLNSILFLTRDSTLQESKSPTSQKYKVNEVSNNDYKKMFNKNLLNNKAKYQAFKTKNQPSNKRSINKKVSFKTEIKHDISISPVKDIEIKRDKTFSTISEAEKDGIDPEKFRKQSIQIIRNTKNSNDTSNSYIKKECIIGDNEIKCKSK